MPITIKSTREIEFMREAGNILAIVHEEMEKMIEPGVTTYAIDKKARDVIKRYGTKPSFLNLYGFPAAVCISVNEEVVHGIPNKSRVLQEGDIVSLDAGVVYKGYHSDAARTIPVGKISAEEKRLIMVTKESFYEGIKFAREGCYLFEISAAIEDYVKAHGYSCVRELVGHGIGTKLHEDPQVPNFRQKRRGMKLQAGMTLAIEPMVNAGRCDVRWLADNWTVVTQDGSYSAHYENTVLITKGEPELLSIRR